MLKHCTSFKFPQHGGLSYYAFNLYIPRWIICQLTLSITAFTELEKGLFISRQFYFNHTHVHMHARICQASYGLLWFIFLLLETSNKRQPDNSHSRLKTKYGNLISVYKEMYGTSEELQLFWHICVQLPKVCHLRDRQHQTQRLRRAASYCFTLI